MSNKISVSLLIATYNWPKALDLVLMSVCNQTVMPNEIVIADDGSKEDTKELIEQYRTKISIPILHIWQEDIGFRKTLILNKAINAISSDYIVQIDGDIILNKHFIADHIKHAQPNYFIKGSRALLTEEKTQWQLQHRDINIHSFQKGVKSTINGRRFPLAAFLFYGDSQKTRNTKGCNFAFWKKDFVKINGYNIDLTDWGHEDIEIAARLVNAGVQRKQLKMVAVGFHLHHNASNQNSSENVNRNFEVYLHTVKEKISVCENGYQQSI